MKKYTFHVSGMHCPSCPILIRSELLDVPQVTNAAVFLKRQDVEIEADFGDKTETEVASFLNEKLKSYGYSLSLEKHGHSVRWTDFKIAVPAALGFILFFIALQKLGIVNLVSATEVSYGTAFVIGLIASVSTCMAVVGGLLLSMSANFAKGGDAVRPQIIFHLGRLVSFFVLGGAVGAFGSLFKLGGTGTLILGLVVGLVLLILGLNLLDIFPAMKKLQPSLPGFIGHHINGLKNLNHMLTPLLLGIATFFLPCGFTQSMQIYALGTGSFLSGAMIMFMFALGTLPVLSLVSFSSLGVNKYARSGVFFKTAGLVVIFFGLFNLMNSLVAAGIISPLFSF
jgi:sulfite exporter TauE/SafE/copper chaperone CopZ